MGSDPVGVLIFDDDANCAELMAQVVRELGSEPEKFYDGTEAFDLIRLRMPRVVILDIMMPGADGLSICRQVKSDSRTSGIRVLISSAKKFKEDREEALRCGADGFIPKPYDLARVREMIQRHLDASPAAPKQDRPPETAPTVMTLTVWGSRGAGDPGEPTACATLDVTGRRLFLDAGTGLWRALESHGELAKETWLLLTHYHPDHVSGLGALMDLGPEWAVKVVGPADTKAPLAEVLRSAFRGGYPRAAVKPYEIGESRFQLWTEVWVSALFTRHPGATLAYRVENHGRAVIYCPDNELEEALGARTDFTDKFAKFIKGADLLVHDARFDDEDYTARAGGGHGCPSMVVEAAAREGVRRVALFHMESRYSSARMGAMLSKVRASLQSRRSSLAADLAVPGATFSV